MNLDLTQLFFLVGGVSAITALIGRFATWGKGATRNIVKAELSEGSKLHKQLAGMIARTVEHHAAGNCLVRKELVDLIEHEREERREGRGELLKAIEDSEKRQTTQIGAMRVELLSAVSHLVGRVDALMNGRH